MGNETAPVDSEPLELAALKETVGGGSSSVMIAAVPEKARLTVTVWPDTADRVAVTVATPPASDMGLPVKLKVTVGAGSSSMMVHVPTEVAIVALVGLERSTVKVSSGSSRLSGLILTVKVLVVSPGLKVTVVIGIAV